MVQKRLMRGAVLACMATLLLVTVGMEALWWAHDWARRFAEQGRYLPPNSVAPVITHDALSRALVE